MIKKLLNAINDGWMEIRHNALRSVLSLIGIVLGVVNLSTMFSVVQGAQTANDLFIQSMGETDIIEVALDWGAMWEMDGLQKTSLTWEDYNALKRNVKSIDSIGVEIYLHENLTYGSNYYRYTTIGITPETFDMQSYDVDRGRRFTQIDLEEGNRVCIVGTTVVEYLFDGEDPIGETVKIDEDYFKVVGVLKEYGTYSGYEGSDEDNPLSWKNRRVLIPATTAIERYIGWNGSGDYFVIYARSVSAEMAVNTIGEIENVLFRSRADNDIFDVYTLSDYQDSLNETAEMWKIVLGIVAGISLLVGGIGIMNVMLATFNERIREIGVRKAIGASNGDIFLLFLVETVVICLLGGVIGLGLGYGVSMIALRSILQEMMSSTPEFSWDAGLASILFSFLIGLICGIYPAWKAARLQPVDALRYE